MYTKEAAKTAAARLDGTHAVTSEDGNRGRRTAKVGKHTTNGVVRHVVHVTTEDGYERAATISNAEHPLYPMGQ